MITITNKLNIISNFVNIKFNLAEEITRKRTKKK